MSDKKLQFSTVDYGLFSSTLILSLLIGVYYQCRKKSTDADELLTGGKKMPLIPTAMSLMASFVSGISFLAFPAEIYTMGAGVCWLVVGAIVADLITVFVIIPVLYEVRGISIYTYFEQRFNSKLLRLYSSFLFISTTLVWDSVALYAPSVALAKVTGFPPWIMILSIGTICAVYTSMGGLKAVVWTDTFQAVVMYGGLVAAVVIGTLTVGYAQDIMDIAKFHGRLDGFTNLDPSPFQYMSIWIGIFGGTCSWLGGYGSSQLAQQRYRSLPSARKAQIVVFMNIPIIIVIYFLIYYNAFLMFANYSDCDPIKTGHVKGKDQLVVFYTMDLLRSIYGLPGLFLASICSATLSTISSGINAMAAVCLDDYLRLMWPDLETKTEWVLTKVISLFFGIVITGMAFAAEPLGGVFATTQKLAGVLGGPLVGLMMLGIMVPKAERIGASIGMLVGTSFVTWIFVGATLNGVQFEQLETSTDGCYAKNISMGSQSSINNSMVSHSFKSYDYLSIYRTSFSLYPFLGATPVFVVGSLISLLIVSFRSRGKKIHGIDELKPINRFQNKKSFKN